MEIQLIEKTNGRINRVTGTTIKERLKVCAYCRVSTAGEEQLNSYQSQLKYYGEKKNGKSEWQFAGIYADEAISGTLDFKRTNFMKMIADCMEGKKEELYNVGIIEMKTLYGNKVKVYDLERTICDIIRNKKKIEIALFTDAMKRYAERKDRNSIKLHKYAKLFNIEDEVRKYLEVLL